MTIDETREQITALAGREPDAAEAVRARAAVDSLKQLLNAGQVRAALPDGEEWRVQTWVKEGILLGFRIGRLSDVSINGMFRYFDKDTFPLRSLRLEDNVRVVPGGSSIRDGAYVAPGVVCMPPMYINVGAYVDAGTMVDSHALVGSCAQIGRRVHLSAGAQIGGVLEPVGAMPVVVEDDVFVGGNCGVYEGTRVRHRAVLAAGVILTGGSTVYDLVHQRILRREPGRPLTIPAGAVVIPGSRPLEDRWARDRGLQVSSPVIIKYRDERTEASTALEGALR
jgi:2,3,4,5-tetrahydropyridine-2-carboxylate N-succinyltransferase